MMNRVQSLEVQLNFRGPKIGELIRVRVPEAGGSTLALALICLLSSLHPRLFTDSSITGELCEIHATSEVFVCVLLTLPT